MREKIRRLLVLLLAVAFVGGGFGRVALSASALEPCHAGAHQGHSHDQQATQAGSHDHGHVVGHAVHPEHLNGGADATDTDPGDKACFKCCGVCTAAAFGLLPPSGDMSLARSIVVYLTAA